jgi:hypothetical protein
VIAGEPGGLFGVFALVESPLDVLLRILVPQVFLTLAEPALAMLLGIFGGELFLAFAEPADFLVLRELLRICLPLGKAALERRLRIRRMVGTICGHLHPPSSLSYVFATS